MRLSWVVGAERQNGGEYQAHTWEAAQQKKRRRICRDSSCLCFPLDIVVKFFSYCLLLKILSCRKLPAG